MATYRLIVRHPVVRKKSFFAKSETTTEVHYWFVDAASQEAAAEEPRQYGWEILFQQELPNYVHTDHGWSRLHGGGERRPMTLVVPDLTLRSSACDLRNAQGILSRMWPWCLFIAFFPLLPLFVVGGATEWQLFKMVVPALIWTAFLLRSLTKADRAIGDARQAIEMPCDTALAAWESSQRQSAGLDVMDGVPWSYSGGPKDTPWPQATETVAHYR
jgi:hypothetical protein